MTELQMTLQKIDKAMKKVEDLRAEQKGLGHWLIAPDKPRFWEIETEIHEILDAVAYGRL